MEIGKIGDSPEQRRTGGMADIGEGKTAHASLQLIRQAVRL